MDYKISEESAQKQLNLFVEYYDIDLDLLAPNKNRVCKKIILGIKLGKIEIVEEGQIKIHQYYNDSKNGDQKITYGPITGFIRVEVNKMEDGMNKIYYLISALSQEDKAIFQRMEGLDILIAECIGGLFLIQ